MGFILANLRQTLLFGNSCVFVLALQTASVEEMLLEGQMRDVCQGHRKGGFAMPVLEETLLLCGETPLQSCAQEEDPGQEGLAAVGARPRAGASLP